MALTEKTEIGKIEVVGKFNFVQVREDNVIYRDGEEISRSYHRYVVSPGQDYTQFDSKVQAVCEAVHTAEVVQAYQASLETTMAELANG
jgi:hypothetical protein